MRILPSGRVEISISPDNLLNRAGRLQALDSDRKPIANALGTGFFVGEDDGLYLYTTWHFVTGWDPYYFGSPKLEPNRRFNRRFVELVFAKQLQISRSLDHEGFHAVTLPLYANPEVIATFRSPLRPLWQQNSNHVSHVDLNAIGLHIPTYHDLVKLKLPHDFPFEPSSVVYPEQVLPAFPLPAFPSERCLIVGYPYGFTSHGIYPEPIVFTRHIASRSVPGRWCEMFVDGVTAPGVSGGPVFVERPEGVRLFGAYTGAMYPDASRHGSRDGGIKVTDLGTVVELSAIFSKEFPLVPLPPTEAKGYPPPPQAWSAKKSPTGMATN